ncbi:MAG: response regulator transcription factor [Planctomycetota bacterium]
MESILVVEDDSHIKLGLEMNLRREGFNVISTGDGEKGYQLAIDEKPDLIILDVMLPHLSGYEICKALRKNDVMTPIIMLTAKNQEIDKIMGFELGADDYLTKPFSLRELIARVNANLRRKRAWETQIEVHEFDGFSLDLQGQTLVKNGADGGVEAIELSQKEFQLLRYFLQNQGVVLSRKQILNQVWGYDYTGIDRTVDNFINRLRTKLEEDPGKPRLIQTVRGAGYKFLIPGRPGSGVRRKGEATESGRLLAGDEDDDGDSDDGDRDDG